MECELCQIRERDELVLYQDKEVVIALKDTVVTPGQITVYPKEHITILEMVSDNILMRCSELANKVSIAAFESLGSQGTNIVVRNGLGAGQNVPHFSIEIIPRQENDGLNFQWDAKQISDDEMERVVSLLQVELKKLDSEIKQDAKKVKKNEKKDKNEDAVEPDEEEKENYLLRHVRRIP